MCQFDDRPMAEYEARVRFKYCAEKLGHEFFEISSNSCLKGTNIHADNLELDFIFCQDTGVLDASAFPDVYSCFSNWSPNGFLIPEGLFAYFANMSKHDIIIGGNQSYKIEREILQHPDIFADFIHLVPSVPKDFILPPIKRKEYRLFYVGINLEKIQGGKTRHIPLLKYLDKKNMIDIYGPSSLFGCDNLWGDFRNYKGEIPFDGKTILKKINDAGICLALHSPAHNNNESVSNRIFEAAASGAVVITDKNKYIEKYFGDSVYYVDYDKTEEEQSEDIKKYIEEIQQNPDMAYEKASIAQQIFRENLTFDIQIENTINKLNEQKEKLIHSKWKYIVDIICFIEKCSDFLSIKKEIEKQYYKNINVIILHRDKIDTPVDKNYTFIDVSKYEKNEGLIFEKIMRYLKGDFFMILNKFSAMHKNHINKLVDSLYKRKNLFAYTGTYIRYEDHHIVLYYTTLNSRAIRNNEFLSLLRSDLNSPIFRLLKIEEEFAPACVLFRKEILNFVDSKELQLNTTSLQLYFALCSIIKHNDRGHYLNTISSGYKLHMNQNLSDVFNEIRKYFNEYKRCENTVLKNLFISFFKYDIDPACCILEKTQNESIMPNTIPSKEMRILNKIEKSKSYKKFVHLFCPEGVDIYAYLGKHRKLKNFLFFMKHLFPHTRK